MKKNFTTETKFWKVMKICAIQGMLAMILCGMSVAHNNYAQLLDKRVTFSFQEVSLERALKEIGAVADVKFFYSVDQLDLEEKISFDAVNRTLREVLDELFGPYQIKYKVHENKSTITLKKENDEPEPETSLPDEQGTDAVVPDNPVATITGKVTDATMQQPMAGVNVIVKGTTEGTTTDANGIFTIWAEDKDMLVFSFIGYVTFETQVGGRTAIDVVLQADIRSLKEVEVNAGYWEVKERERTGNISTVTSEDIQKQPISNPIAALQARVPGLEITQQNGVPGGNFKVRIRGTNSIANGNDPLYIIDGVPYMSSSMSFLETSGGILGNPSPAASQGSSPLNSINPSDIESIDILKDADATAIYGSRGSNGVILITTKKGKPGRTQVDFNFYTGIGKVTHKMDLLSTKQYLAMRREAFANDGITPTIANARDLMLWDTTQYTDWQKKLIGGTANTTDVQLSISGGDKSTQFSIGGGYHKETTVFPGDNFDQRVSTHVSVVNTSSNQKLKSSISINYSVNQTDLIKQDLTLRAIGLPPDSPALYDENGALSWDNWSSTYENPLAFLKRKYEAAVNNLIGNVLLRYAILPNLEVRASLGYTSIVSSAVTMTPLSSLDSASAATTFNQAYFSDSEFKNWIIEPQLNWVPKLGNGRFDVLLGTTFLDQTTDGLAQNAYGFTSESLMRNLAAAPNRSLATNYYSQYRYHAVFGRINYLYKDKYIINLTARRDGSSRFGPGKQFANFGAIGTAWLFSEEPFVKNLLMFLCFGKLRLSYGITGNDQLGDYQYLDSYTSSQGIYQGVIGLSPVRLSNPDFAWETNKKFEIGLELGAIDNRILGSVSFYRNRSSNQLIGYPLPPTTGFSSIQGNFPATVENTGVEIELNTSNIETISFNWSTSLNVSIPHNKLLEFPNLESVPNYANIYVIGEPLSIKKQYDYNGLDPVTGLYTVDDVNGDDALNFEDRQTIKFIGQHFSGGFRNSFKYKGFQLDVLFQFVKQTGYNYALFFDTPGVMANQPDLVLGRWQAEGSNSSIQRFTTGGIGFTTYTRYNSSEEAIVNASFIRLKNLSLSYIIPKKIAEQAHLFNARVFLQGQNLMTITSYKGLDPENQSNNLPPLKILTGGISLTF